MIRDDISNEYFEWLYNLVSQKRFSEGISHRELLMYLHRTEFIFLIPMDVNRAEDGVTLRYRFSVEYGLRNIPTCLNGPCSVLEMMVALAIKCEEEIMDDANIGDRTAQWFWDMIVNLGLGGMPDGRFDTRLAKHVITRFLNREYDPDGRGGLFYIKNCKYDLRTVEIWHQMCWYLDSII